MHTLVRVINDHRHYGVVKLELYILYCTWILQYVHTIFKKKHEKKS